VGALTTAAAAGRAFGAPAVQPPPPHLIIEDSRYAESAAFAAQAGAPVFRIDGDVTALWYERLDRDWRTRQSVVAGLTGADALFCLERLAMDRGLRAVFKVERQPASGERPALVHWIIAPKPRGAGA